MTQLSPAMPSPPVRPSACPGLRVSVCPFVRLSVCPFVRLGQTKETCPLRKKASKLASSDRLELHSFVRADGG